MNVRFFLSSVKNSIETKCLASISNESIQIYRRTEQTEDTFLLWALMIIREWNALEKNWHKIKKRKKSMDENGKKTHVRISFELNTIGLNRIRFRFTMKSPTSCLSSMRILSGFKIEFLNKIFAHLLRECKLQRCHRG